MQNIYHGLGRSPREGKATYSSILAWRIPWTTVHGVTKSLTQLSDFHFPISDQGFVYKIHKELSKLNKKKASSPFFLMDR